MIAAETTFLRQAASDRDDLKSSRKL